MNTNLATRQLRLNEWATIIKECKASGRKLIFIVNSTDYP